ncbi:esterase family protein [Austwickia sp. TVS 96-490-7B]|uniref:alpha/beta hydrolase n=1 Tax=Austwickia sp. TVS 96-490-7B TaxID=2830843 RepID=UPI001C596A9C|nr:alpha/beta hydrolase-fold protein [Austwickia sp. TVS 96-490-7B]
MTALEVGWAPTAILPATSIWQHPWVLQVLRLPVVGWWPEIVTYVVTTLLVLLLLTRHPQRFTRRWLTLGGATLLAGLATGVLLVLVVDVWLQMIPDGLPLGGQVWVVLCCAVLALVGLDAVCCRWWRKVLAVLAIVPMVAVTAVGINASYGILDTVGALIGKPTTEIVDARDLLKGKKKSSPSDSVRWIAQTWKAPAGMPEKGKRSTVAIPGTASGFEARPASLYLPPAAQVADPPALPVVVMLMGQPGTPDVGHIADALDRKAAAHQGLAPIVVVADQLADPLHDTLCMDTELYGKAETYVNTDVVAWIKSHLNVRQQRADWVIAGYSNGGLCAARFVTRHTSTWGNALDISGEEFPGSDAPAKTLSRMFNGDKAAYDATRVPTMMASANFADTWTVFTICADDTHHITGARRKTGAARKSGAHAVYIETRRGGHGVVALDFGLDRGFDALYPRLGFDAELSPEDAARTTPEPPPPPSTTPVVTPSVTSPRTAVG